jgi:hypothetical protein
MMVWIWTNKISNELEHDEGNFELEATKVTVGFGSLFKTGF